MQPLLTAERSSATEVSTEEERARRGEERVAQQPQREPPFTSLAAEVRQFLRTALPLSVASAFKYAAPPTFTMAIAGHIDVASSALLQEALGYAIMYYKIAASMPLLSCEAYFRSVVPGCIGAGRVDRLPRYLHRSLLTTACMLIPTFVLLQYSEPIIARVGLPANSAREVGVYTRWMSLSLLISALDDHLECLCVNLGHVKFAAANALLTGCGVELVCAWFFIYHLGWGTRGAALTVAVNKSVRVGMWLALLCCRGLWRSLLLGPKRATPSPAAAVDGSAAANGAIEPAEALVSWRELRVFFGLAAPQFASHLSGWGCYELQLVVLSNIQGIDVAGRAAGAMFVAFETTFASVQQGWVQAINMRTLKLLGREDAHGAPRAMAVAVASASVLVAGVNIPLLLAPRAIARLVSNDANVVDAMAPLLWVLAAHLQARLLYFSLGEILIPFGHRLYKLVANCLAFWAIGAPVAVVAALTGAFYPVGEAVQAKMALCFLCTVIANCCCAFFFGFKLVTLDWRRVARRIANRANTDRSHAAAAQAVEDDEEATRTKQTQQNDYQAGRHEDRAAEDGSSAVGSVQ